MKIYTKKGDKGETSLFGGERVRKDSLRIESYGTIDEMNSVLGIVRSFNSHKEIGKIISVLQNDLFIVGADLATPLTIRNKVVPRIKKTHIYNLERIIDSLELKLKPLKTFILPGGSIVGAYLHHARTICRRAERNVVRLMHSVSIHQDIVVYLNRLSDLLFVIARYSNQLNGISEEQWRSGKRNVKEK